MLAELIVLVVVPAALVTAGAYDLTSYTIPNPVQFVLLLAFAGCAVFLPLGIHALGLHLLAGAIGLALGFTLFALGFVGGGDAKLFACASLWIGLGDLPAYALVSSVLGGLLTLLLLALRRIPLPASLTRHDWIMRLHDERAGIPYGIALSVAALGLLPQVEIFRTALAG